MYIHINNETAPRTFVKFHHTVLHVVIENFKTVYQKLGGIFKR